MSTNDAILNATPATTWPLGFAIAKRVIDITGSLVCLVFALPVIALCGLWIKLVDGGPVFYHQWRVGRDGWLFRITKIRTMQQNAEKAGASMATRNDPRVLPGCRWMRKSHVDELPQLISIFMGQMSLVGPRPERPEILDRLRHDLPAIDQRLAGTPGLTGLAQIRSGYSNDLAGARRKLVYDLFYLRRRRITTELWLILKTFPRFWDRNAH